jgi:hypothetical protein
MRGNGSVKINPFSSKFHESIICCGQRLDFRFKKSRLFNQSYTSEADLGDHFGLFLKQKFKKISIHCNNHPDPITVISPTLFPFLSVSFFTMELPEGIVEFTISRSSSKLSYGTVKYNGRNYQYLYKFMKYKSEDFVDMFPDGLLDGLSINSIYIVSLVCLWINAYNAPSYG